MALRKRLAALFRGNQLSRELEDEVRWHVETRTEELIASGVSPEEPFAATKLLASLTFGIGKYDPVSFFATIALLIAIALLAGYIPARRAMAVDPMIALRYD